MPSNATTLRSYRPDDLPHLLRICLATGDGGHDASAIYRDPDLLGQYFAAPYAVHEPRLCLVLEDTLGPCGYVLGTADTASFAHWFNGVWLPELRRNHVQAEIRNDSPEADLYRLVKADMTVPPWVEEYPAHLHIDLLPRAQGKGEGRRMIEAWLREAAGHGAAGAHLGVSPANQRAIGFYEHVGFTRLPAPPEVVYFGRRL